MFIYDRAEIYVVYTDIKTRQRRAEINLFGREQFYFLIRETVLGV